MQGLWVEASRSMSELAQAMKEAATAERASANAERTRAAMEQTYWLAERGFYAFGTRPALTTEIPKPSPARTAPCARRAWKNLPERD